MLSRSFVPSWLGSRAVDSPSVPGTIPPLGVWLATAALCVLTLSVTLPGFILYHPWVEANRARLAELHRENGQHAGGARVVIAVGDSKLRFATADEAVLAEAAAQRGVRDLRFLRITRDAADFRDFTALADEILATRADLVILQLDLLVREPPLLNKYWAYLRKSLGTVLRGHPLEERLTTVCNNEAVPDWNADDRGWRRTVRSYEDRGVDPTAPGYQRIKDLVGRAERLGVDVVLLAVPATSRARDHFYGSGNSFYPGVMATIEADGLLEAWQYPGRLSDEQHYCDFLHLNERGRDLFSRWLADALAARLLSEPTL